MVDEVEDLVQEASIFVEGATIDTRSVALSYWTMFELVPGQRKTSASKNVGITLYSCFGSNQQGQLNWG